MVALVHSTWNNLLPILIASGRILRFGILGIVLFPAKYTPSFQPRKLTKPGEFAKLWFFFT